MYESSKVAEIIKGRAKANGVQLKDMLLELHLNKNTLSNMYNGSMLKGDSLARIADYLDCSVDYLLGRTDDPRPVGKMGRPTPAVESGPPGYSTLPKAKIDQIVAVLKENEPPNIVPIQISAIAQGGDEPTTEADSAITLPKNTKALPAQDKAGTGDRASVPEEK